MAGLSPGGGRAGHPDLVGRAAAVLKVTAVGRDPLWAATHGSSIRVLSGSLKLNAQNWAFSVVYCTLLLLHLPSLHSLIVDQGSGFISPIACHASALHKTAQFMSQHLWNLEPLH